MTVLQEPGFTGVLVSLGGLRSLTSRGRQVETNQVTVSAAGELLLSDNSRRISAIITNRGGNTLSLCLGRPAVSSDYITLLDAQSFQIDALFPWTGSVYGLCVAGTTVHVTEVYIP